MARSKLIIRPAAHELLVENGTPLEQVLFSQGVEFPCGGESLCGRCRVRVLEGELAVTAAMRAVLTEGELARGWRLACQARVEGPLTLEIAQWEASILTDETALPFEPAQGIGIAIDLGTTTLVVQAVDLATGEVLSVISGMNPQAAHGADVMSRIQFALSADEGAERLTRIVREALGGMIHRALDSCGRGAGEVREALIAGNTVMHHLFLRLPGGAALARSVCHGKCRTLQAGRARSRVGVAGCVRDPVPAVPGLDSWAATCWPGIVACGLEHASHSAALIDLGTNGEIVLSDSGRILCASTAAGPAFEGGGIRMGGAGRHGRHLACAGWSIRRWSAR